MSLKSELAFKVGSAAADAASAPARPVGDDATGGIQFAGRHAPVGRGRLQQHLACRRPDASQLRIPTAHRKAADGRLLMENGIVVHYARGCILDDDTIPIAAQFLVQDHGHGRVAALTHLHGRRDDGDPIVGSDLQERGRRARRRHALPGLDPPH